MVPVGHAATPLVAAIARDSRYAHDSGRDERQRLRCCLDEQHRVGVRRNADDVASAARATVPLPSATREAAKLEHLAALRHNLEGCRRIVRHTPDCAVGGLNRSIPLVFEVRVKLGADHRRAMARRLNLEHPWRVRRRCVDVAVASQAATVPLPFTRRQLAAPERRERAVGMHPQHKVGASWDAVYAAVRSEYPPQPFEWTFRYLRQDRPAVARAQNIADRSGDQVETQHCPTVRWYAEELRTRRIRRASKVLACPANSWTPQAYERNPARAKDIAA